MAAPALTFPSWMLGADDRADIQGIVTTGFGHLSYAGLLFARFTSTGGAAGFLDALLPDVTTAAPWGRGEDKRKPEHTLNVSLTYAGLERLGLPSEALRGFPTEFVAGMPSRAAVLGDRGESAPGSWEIGAPREDTTIHALLLVHAGSSDAVQQRLDALRSALIGTGEEAAPAQEGQRRARSREHFGFANDGLSQPNIEGLRHEDLRDAWTVRRGEFLLGHLNEMGIYPASAGVEAANDPDGVLPPFPSGALPGCRDFGRNGSYLVYRKLEQHVERFWTFVRDQCAPAASGEPDLQRRMLVLVSKLMGRWPGGAPLVLAPDYDDPGLSERNDFLYRPTDAGGFSCPLGAHIRRANPRDAVNRVRDTAEQAIASANQHRILRRGIGYGEPAFDPREIEDGRAPLEFRPGPRGLHFIALNADIKRQFEFVQQTWLNNPKFAGLHADKDAVVGDNETPGRATIQARPVRRAVRGIPRFVTVRGGAYLFLPSITALRFLARRS